MKRIILFSWVMVMLLFACDTEKNELAPSDRPDARLNKVMSEYKALLTGAEWGWKATLYPDGGSRYSFHFNFSENDRVKMLSDINATTASEAYESTYRLRSMQKPSLLFDTYSYIHILSDPDERKSGGERGQGRNSDFEFYFNEATENSIELVGNYNGSRLILERATQEEATNHIAGIAATVGDVEKLNEYATYFKRLSFGGKVFDISANTNLRTITFFYYDGNIQRAHSSGYYYGAGQLVLLEPFITDNITIHSLENISYSVDAGVISLTINDVRASIQEAEAPIKTDLFAGRDFYNNPPNGSYAISISGFTVENKEDAYNLFSIDDYYFLVYWPQFSQIEGNEELGGKLVDLFGFILFNAAEQRPEIGFGPALLTNPTNDGRVVFTEVDEFGETPDQAMPMVRATIDQLVIPEGFYVIRTEGGGFDLVSAKNAKSWISFF